MKVNIGPYKNWIGPYQIADAIFFWVPKYPEDKDEQRWDVKLRDKFGDYLSDTWVAEFCQWVFSKRKRKIDIKIDDYDVWNADYTLALITLPLLKRVKETKHGSPMVDDKDVPKELRSTSAAPKENEWDIDEHHHARWDYVIDEMIWAFEQITVDDDEELLLYASGDKVALQKYNKRLNNGLMLFGKYYRGLWV